MIRFVERNEINKRTGTFAFVAVLDSVGQRLPELIPFSVKYVYLPPDVDAVQYLRIVDDRGREYDPSELHGASLFHAFKAHVESQKAEKKRTEGVAAK